MSLLEVMYLKKYCIVSNILGNNDVIKNGENGFVGNNKTDYINIIKKLSKNNSQYSDLVDCAYSQLLSTIIRK